MARIIKRYNASTHSWETLELYAVYAADSDKLDGHDSSYFATSGHEHTLSLATDSGNSSITLAYGTKYKLTAGGKTLVFTMPSSDNTNTWRPLGTGATDACAGNDSRLSDARTPTSHTHGNISNDGKVASSAVTAASGIVVIDSDNVIQRVTNMATFRTIIGAGTSSFTGYSSTNKLDSAYITNNAGWTSNAGTVTSVSAGTGLSISGTASTTPTVNIASGYKLPTTTEWSNKSDTGHSHSYAGSASIGGPATNVAYTTTAPSTANNDGIKIAVLSSEPSTKYSGWLYLITG